jgi:5-(carboxyamino)imidazole ribonucleotide synthase
VPSDQKFDLGFLGGGQLARMSILAARPYGVSTLSLDPGEDTPAARVGEAIVGRLDNPADIATLMRRCRRLTLENEFIPAAAIMEAARQADFDLANLVPGPHALSIIQDKLKQRFAYQAAGVPSPHAVSLEDGGAQAKAEIGFPMMLKARFGGYDGKGTRYARTEAEFEQHADTWQKGGWLAEAFVPFVRELAVMVCVPENGPAASFPTMATEQRNHVCDVVYPCDSDGSEIAEAAVRAMGGIGLFGVELFEFADSQLLVNEIAEPRSSSNTCGSHSGCPSIPLQVANRQAWPISSARTRNLILRTRESDSSQLIQRRICTGTGRRKVGRAESSAT